MSLRRVVVVSSAVHYRVNDRVFAYAPYAREIELWADLFPHLVIAAPEGTTEPPGDCIPIDRDNVALVGFPRTGGDTISAKLAQVFVLPWLLMRLSAVLRQADAIHVRCPGNLGLLGVLLAPLFSRRLVAKYAGQWTGYPGEARTVRLQRWLLSSRWWRGPVTVYGDWPSQPPNVVPFFTSVLARSEVERGGRSAQTPRPHDPVRLLFVGRLSDAKHADAAISACPALSRLGVPAVVRIVGDGPERTALEMLAIDLGVDAHFCGALPAEEVLGSYEWADALVLVSDSEGWPKAITEAMTYGLVCVGSDRGLVPSLLDDGRGLVVPPGDGQAVADAIASLIADPDGFRDIGHRASVWASRHSLDRLSGELHRLLEARWQVRLGQVADTSPEHPSVIHVIDSLASGGAERVALELSNGLARRGYPVALVTTRADGPLASMVSDDVERLSLQRRSAVDPRGIMRLWRQVRGMHQPVILHAHSTSVFVAAAVSLLPPWPKVIWHDHFGRLESGAGERPAWLYRLVMHRVAFVLSVSEGLRRWAVSALGVAPDRARVVPNALPFTARASRSYDDIAPGRPRLVCVANLRPEKDHPTLIQAMAKVVEGHPSAHLVLAGSGAPDYVASLERDVADAGLADHVTLLGHCDDVPGLLATCDVGVLASRSEAFPLALLDYGAAGLPVVATDVGDCRVALEDGRAGVLVPPGSPSDLATAIVDLLAHEDHRAVLALAFNERVRTIYSRDAVLRQIEEAYRAVAGGRP